MPSITRDVAGALRRVGFPHPPHAWRLVRAASFAWLALRLVLAGSLYLTNGHACRLTLRQQVAALAGRFPCDDPGRALAELDVARVLGESSGLLSGGERQRVEVALGARAVPA